MMLERMKKILQQVIKDKQLQVKPSGDSIEQMGEIKQLVEAAMIIDFKLILAENKELKSLLREGIELMEKLEIESIHYRDLYYELKGIRPGKRI